MIYNDPVLFMGKKAALISFTIDGMAYQAEDGMTWYEWCQSSYNTGGFSCSGNSASVFVGVPDAAGIYIEHQVYGVTGENQIAPDESYRLVMP